jgi:hypothetical protein
LTGWLRTTINNLSTSWELEPPSEVGKAARGDALVDQLCYMGATMRDRVWDSLHIEVKRAMAVVCLGFSYDMEVVSHGFIMDIVTPGPRLNRINRRLIPTSCNFFSGIPSQKNSKVKHA